MKAALYVLHYIHSTHDYGISFTSNDTAPMHSYVHFPPSSDAEAYDDAVPPKLSSSNTILAYSDACWGSQLGSSVADGTLLPRFKFRSMNGGIIFKNGGPLGWLWERQERTSLSSCKAEIRATNATSKKVVDFRNLSRSVSDAGYVIPAVDAPTLLFNDNEACIRWSHNMTSKAACHIKLCKNSVREWVQDGTIEVEHVSGKINPADIFTKEMRDSAHFCRLRNSFMSRLSDFYELIHTCCSPRLPAWPYHGFPRGRARTGDTQFFRLLCRPFFFFLFPQSRQYITLMQRRSTSPSTISRLCSCTSVLVFSIAVWTQDFPSGSHFFFPFLLDARMGGVGLSLVL